jgi:hypothetical protein
MKFSCNISKLHLIGDPLQVSRMAGSLRAMNEAVIASDILDEDNIRNSPNGF